MAMLTGNIGAINDKDGNPVDLSARSDGGGKQFRLVKPGYYTATIEGLAFPTPNYSKSGNHKNPDHPEGKWLYWRLTPTVRLHNDNGTLINRQDVQLGTVDKNGNYIRPDGDTTKPAMWSTGQFFLRALGLLIGNNGVYSHSFDPDLIEGRVVRVHVAVGGYRKGEKSYTPEEITNMLRATNNGQGYEFEDIPELVALYNSDNNLTGDNELKTKNVITGYYNLNAQEIEESGYYVDEMGGVYLSEQVYKVYLDRVANPLPPSDPF